MKILWVSDSPTVATGFGNVTRCVCTSLADRGHHVSILGGGQPSDQPIPWHNCMLYPLDSSPDKLLNYLRQIQPDVLVIQADVWLMKAFNYPLIINFVCTTGIPWALYYPIDSDMGAKRLPSSLIHILKTVDLPIAMSRYGHDVTEANGIEPAYIPLGINTKVFEPPVDKVLAKQALGYEGKFVVLSDARNQLHKMLPRTLEIFRRFALGKDDVILHLHCDPYDSLARSPWYFYNLRSDIAFLNLMEKVRITKGMSIFTGLPLEQLAKIYQAADVHLLASRGEGFGLPTLQAAATGVVPLASDYAASRELVGKHGEAISIRHFLLDPLGLRRALIDIDDAVSKLEQLYRDRELLASKAQSARDFALSYDWECIVPQWEELLEREVPRKRTSLRSCAEASAIPSDLHGEEGPCYLACGDHQTDELAPELLQEAQLERTIRIPVTLPLVRSKQRISGCVYVASQCDVPSVLALYRIFPGLEVWSTISLDFGSSLPNGKSLQTKVVQANSFEYRPHLAISTLALDIASFDPLLPVEAAKMGVPCIGLAQQREQAWLWPNLSLAKPDPMTAAELGRQMLTDQGVAADACMEARQRLANTLTPSNDGCLESLRK